MSIFFHPKPPARVYRVDHFRVPDAAYGEFLGRLRETHRFLRTLPGFIEDRVLEKTDGPGRFNFVTMAVWESAAAVAAAKSAVTAWRATTGFDPQEMLARLGIEADFASYESIDGESPCAALVPAAELAEASTS
jgi:heme-degrading monooxygenase HmoA